MPFPVSKIKNEALYGYVLFSLTHIAPNHVTYCEYQHLYQNFIKWSSQRQDSLNTQHGNT